MSKSKNNEKDNIALKNFHLGYELLRSHPIFLYLKAYCNVYTGSQLDNSSIGYALVKENGDIFCHHKIRATPEEWAHILAHCFLHLGMDHFNPPNIVRSGGKLIDRQKLVLWNCACDLVVERFLDGLKLGSRPPIRKFNEDSTFLWNTPSLPSGITDEYRLFKYFLDSGLPKEYSGFGTMSPIDMDMQFLDNSDGKTTNTSHSFFHAPTKWTELFAKGLADAVQKAVDKAAGVSITSTEQSNAHLAKSWFISNYPLLGAIAASFKIIEDLDICRRMNISIAAISPSLKEIYINPLANLNKSQCRFVMAHELLHASLRHDARHEWRDTYLWNVACDYVINQWLIEMGIGEQLSGILYDVQFKGLSAEAIYDRITMDMRMFRKLATLRGVGLGDIIPGNTRWWEHGQGIDLDVFYRRAISNGLTYHDEQKHGYLPAGLIEEIRALAQPPIAWDVELARWFDDYFTPLEKKRSYARPSRRQSSTPDIARPNWIISQSSLDGRTYGVVLDTSGSMDRHLLATALGAIASYSTARDVFAVRVIFCDAAAYDQGYLKPEDVSETVKIKGRGGTLLQPGIDLLHNAQDFPKTAPILIITDGYCENHLILYGREHAFLIPVHAKLPFVSYGKVFRMQ